MHTNSTSDELDGVLLADIDVNHSEIEVSQADERLILLLIGSVIFASVVNTSMINVALPAIKDHFNVSEGAVGWIVTGYALTFGIFNAINGRLADIIGRRRMYITGITILGSTSVFVAMSNHIELTIALRIIQGMGAATLPAVGSTIIAEIFPKVRRGAAMGVVMSTAGFAASVGPFIGGFLTEYVSWRSVFACTAGVLLTLPFALKILPKELDKPHTKKFDVVGALLLAIAVATFFFAFHLVQDTGFSKQTFEFLAVSFVFLGAFSIWILKVDRPFISPEVMKDVRYVCTIIVASFVNATRFGTIIMVPIFLQELNHYSPFETALVLLPGALSVAFLSRHAGRFADHHGPRIPVTFGVLLIIAGNLMTAFYAGSSPLMVGVGMGLYGVGYASLQTPLEASISNIMPIRLVSVALGFFMMIFFVSGACGVALSSTLVELQPLGTTSWIGLNLPDPRFSNAIIALNVLAIIAFLMIPFIARKGSRPVIV